VFLGVIVTTGADTFDGEPAGGRSLDVVLAFCVGFGHRAAQ